MQKIFKKLYRKFVSRLYQISLQKIMIISLIIIITLSTVLIAGISYTLSEKIIHRKTLQYSTDILNEISNNINNKLGEVDSLTTYICYNATIQSQIKKLNTANQNHIYEQKRILEKELINITVANHSLMETTIITSSHQAAWISQPALDFPESSPVFATLESKNGSLCWLTMEEDSLPQIIAGRTVNDLGSQLGIGYLLVRFDNRLLLDILNQKQFFESGLLCIADKEGTIISSNKDDYLGKTYEYMPLLKKDTSTIKLKESSEWLTYCTIPGTEWKLISSIPSISYEQEIIQLRGYIITLAILIMCFSIFIVVKISRLIFYPIKNLCNLMPSIGKGDFGVISPSPYQNEIGELYNYFYKMVQDVEKLIYTTNQQQLLLQKTELNSLRMQINPHFLYNTLESIKWTAYMENNEEIVTMVKALGDFMRSSISGSEFISIEKEMENIQCYLIIQKYRYGDKLTVNINIPASLHKAQIPKLLLQPLIENAIVHGLEQKIGKGIIQINGCLDSQDVFIDVADNGIGFSKETLDELNVYLNSAADSSNVFGLGMKNVHQRIQMYYGPKYGLGVSSKYGIETCVRIHIPFSE